MKLKAIVLDIDGTLLNSEKELEKRTKEKLIQAQKKGIKLILASGRPTQGMIHLAEKLEMSIYEGYIVSYNGSSVYDIKNNKIIFNQTISKGLTKEILDHLSEFDVVTMVDSQDYMYVNDAFFDIEYEIPTNYQNIVHYESRGGNFKVTEVDKLSEAIDQPVNKILVAGNPFYLEKNYKKMTKPFKKDVTAAFSAPFYYEYTDLGIDKAKALHHVFPKMDIYPENMIAFGDGQNDCSIIEYAGTGVAMGNAVSEIKAVADAVTDTNDRNGIAQFLDNLF